MRRLIVTELLTLDGVMDSPGGGDHPAAGWTMREVDFDPAVFEIKGREQAEATAMLMGRVTYEEFAPVWPSMTEDFAGYNAMPRYVVSTTLPGPTAPWGEDTVDVLGSLDDVRRLMDGDGGPIIVHGSATLVQALLAARLVDRLHLLVFPVVLGFGKRLWAPNGPEVKLTAREAQTYANGVTKLVYDVVRDSPAG